MSNAKSEQCTRISRAWSCRTSRCIDPSARCIGGHSCTRPSGLQSRRPPLAESSGGGSTPLPLHASRRARAACASPPARRAQGDTQHGSARWAASAFLSPSLSVYLSIYLSLCPLSSPSLSSPLPPNGSGHPADMLEITAPCVELTLGAQHEQK
jgi:hypothetical protein